MSFVVSYQGEPGAFSSQAALQVFPDCELLPCATFEDALAAVSDGKARYGMIPIDNSIAGRVADIHHLLPRSGLHIIGEHFLPIRFHLMGVEGATLATIQVVQSHIHALGQCRKIIRKLGRFVEFSVFGSETTADWSIIGDRKELDIRGAHLGPYCYPIAIDLLSRGLVTSEGVVTHSYALEDWDEALKMAISLDSIKVLMRPGYRANR